MNSGIIPSASPRDTFFSLVEHIITRYHDQTIPDYKYKGVTFNCEHSQYADIRILSFSLDATLSLPDAPFFEFVVEGASFQPIILRGTRLVHLFVHDDMPNTVEGFGLLCNVQLVPFLPSNIRSLDQELLHLSALATLIAINTAISVTKLYFDERIQKLKVNRMTRAKMVTCVEYFLTWLVDRFTIADSIGPFSLTCGTSRNSCDLMHELELSDISSVSTTPVVTLVDNGGTRLVVDARIAKYVPEDRGYWFSAKGIPTGIIFNKSKIDQSENFGFELCMPGFFGALSTAVRLAIVSNHAIASAIIIENSKSFFVGSTTEYLTALTYTSTNYTPYPWSQSVRLSNITQFGRTIIDLFAYSGILHELFSAPTILDYICQLSPGRSTPINQTGLTGLDTQYAHCYSSLHHLRSLDIYFPMGKTSITSELVATTDNVVSYDIQVLLPQAKHCYAYTITSNVKNILSRRAFHDIGDFGYTHILALCYGNRHYIVPIILNKDTFFTIFQGRPYRLSDDLFLSSGPSRFELAATSKYSSVDDSRSMVESFFTPTIRKNLNGVYLASVLSQQSSLSINSNVALVIEKAGVIPWNYFSPLFRRLTGVTITNGEGRNYPKHNVELGYTSHTCGVCHRTYNHKLERAICSRAHVIAKECQISGFTYNVSTTYNVRPEHLTVACNGRFNTCTWSGEEFIVYSAYLSKCQKYLCLGDIRYKIKEMRDDNLTLSALTPFGTTSIVFRPGRDHAERSDPISSVKAFSNKYELSDTLQCTSSHMTPLIFKHKPVDMTMLMTIVMKGEEQHIDFGRYLMMLAGAIKNDGERERFDVHASLFPQKPLPLSIALDASWLDNSAPLHEYARRTCDQKLIPHFPRKKFLYTEIRFILHAINRGLRLCDNPVIIYVGAAPGSHIPLISQMFPTLRFILIDPAKFEVKKSEMHNDCIIYNEIATDSLLDHLKDEFATRQVVLISDIRNDIVGMTIEQQNQVITADNVVQNNIVLRLNPFICMLKMRLPYGPGATTTPFIDGRIMVQTRHGETSTESRLVAESPYTVRDWDCTWYEQALYYHNTITRPKTFFHNYDLPGYDRCFECTVELSAIEEYVASMQPTKTVSEVVQWLDTAIRADHWKYKIQVEAKTYDVPFLAINIHTTPAQLLDRIAQKTKLPSVEKLKMHYGPGTDYHFSFDKSFSPGKIKINDVKTIHSMIVKNARKLEKWQALLTPILTTSAIKFLEVYTYDYLTTYPGERDFTVIEYEAQLFQDTCSALSLTDNQKGDVQKIMQATHDFQDVPFDPSSVLTTVPDTTVNKLRLLMSETYKTKNMKINDEQLATYSALLVSIYDSISFKNNNMQAGPTSTAMKMISDMFNVNCEGFASPLNAFFSNYYSAFPIDTHFGSRGSLFQNDLPQGCYFLNPPFSERCISDTINYVLDQLEDAESVGEHLRILLLLRTYRSPILKELQELDVSPYYKNTAAKRIDLKALAVKSPRYTGNNAYAKFVIPREFELHVLETTGTNNTWPVTGSIDALITLLTS
jgi:hypothetical protein